MIKATVDRLRVGLRKTSAGLSGRLRQLLAGKVTLDQATLERIEELLIGADMGVKSSVAIVQNIERRLQQEGENASLDAVMQVIRSDVKKILTTARPRVSPPNWAGSDAAGGKKKKKKKKKKQQRQNSAQTAQRQPSVTDGTADLEAGGPSAGGVNALDASATPRVIFVVGVNGSGKTTSIAKLAHMLQRQGQSVLIAAADTFRAAAVEQLQIWADRVGAECVQQGSGADPAAVVHDALAAATARGHDVVIVDTAGRLHTKTNLMDELGKIARVILKKTGRPPETLLVVDANTGQNGLAQAKVFAETIPVDGLILAKLDGTAKGGIVVAIAETIGLPVKYVGVGEQAEDLAEFDPDLFVEALFAAWQEAPEVVRAEPQDSAAKPAAAVLADSPGPAAEEPAYRSRIGALLVWSESIPASLFE